VIIFQAGDVFAGRFRLEERIGQGGMGQVWRATQLGLGREVALKLVHPHVDDDARYRQMFLLEAQVSARLAHPNIVPVVDFGEHEGGILWLVQIFIRGSDLGGLLHRSPGGLAFPLAGHIVTQILLGLQCAHDNGVMHRDLKPGNVLISRAGDVQITDFGIAKVIAENQTPSVSTVLKGSPGYLAPELLRGLPPRPSSDVFSVGGLFVELLTGKHPFIKAAYADRDQIFFSTLNDAVPPLAESNVQAPPGADAVIQKLVAKDPEARYQSAAQALDDLYHLLAPFGGDASSLALKRFIATTKDTFVAKPAESIRSSFGPSGVSGQMASPTPSMPGLAVRKPRPRRRLLALGALAVLAGVGGGVAMVAGQKREILSTAAIPPIPLPKGRLVVTLTPPDAQLEAAGKRISGTSPFAIEGLEIGAKLALHAEREGYAPDEREVTVVADGAVTIDLRANPPPPAAAPPPLAPAEPAAPAEKKPRPKKRQPSEKPDLLPI
jgi:eukaryotic-like serine/threonine-protein kinase